jgi:hypothetical protein
MKTRYAYSYHRATQQITLRDGTIKEGEFIIAEHDSVDDSVSVQCDAGDLTLTGTEFAALQPSLVRRLGTGC